MRPRLYEARPETLGVDLLPLLAKTGGRFIAGEATGLELGDGAVVLGTGARVGYDRLVVATGSRKRRPPVQIGRAHVLTPGTNADIVCRRLLYKKNKYNDNR